jgi:hypothetical protein
LRRREALLFPGAPPGAGTSARKLACWSALDRREGACHRLSDPARRARAEKLLGLRVHEDDEAASVLHDHGIRRGLDGGSEEIFLLTSLRDVTAE